MSGAALTFRSLCADQDPELIALPAEEDSFVALFYCVKRDHTPPARRSNDSPRLSV